MNVLKINKNTFTIKMRILIVLLFVLVQGLPRKFDWRKPHSNKDQCSKEIQVLPDVRDQGGYYNGWAYSSVESIEALIAIKSNKNVRYLNTNQVQNCAGFNNKTNYPEFGYYYAQKIGLCKDVPGKNVSCDKLCCVENREFLDASEGSSTYPNKLATYHNITRLKEMILRQPLVVSINADYYFQTYSANLLRCNSTGNMTTVFSKLNHSVLLIGYYSKYTNTDSSEDYWIIQNSWGTDWGMNGYAHITMNYTENCGLDISPIYPIMYEEPCFKCSYKLPNKIIVPLEQPEPLPSWEMYAAIYHVDVNNTNYRNNYYNNSLKILNHNMNCNRTFNMGVNSMTYMSESEMNVRLGYNSSLIATPAPEYTGQAVQSTTQVKRGSFDWRTQKGPAGQTVLTPVKDQGQCGSCWSFSTTTVIESATALKIGNNAYSMSEQEFVSCDIKSTLFGSSTLCGPGKCVTNCNEGCEGGVEDYAYSFVQCNKLVADNVYPYVSGNGNNPKCEIPLPASSPPSVKIGAFEGKATAYNTKDFYNNVYLLQQQVEIQPISVNINSKGSSFAFYSGGVYSCSNTYNEKTIDSWGKANIDHAVVLVGYNTLDQSNPYWIVRNSWGTSWGIQGYFYVSMMPGKDCGLILQPTWPVIDQIVYPAS